MRSLDRLTRLFRYVTSLTAVSGTVLACSSGVARDGIDENICIGGQYLPLAKVTSKVPVDYMALNGWAQAGAVGTPCSKATDAAACQEKLKALSSNPRGAQCGEAGCIFLAYTRGDEVGSVRTPEEAKAFLSFESVHDAAFLAWVAGYTFECEQDNANTTASGFELVARTGSGCGTGDDVTEYRLAVGKDGVLSVQETVVVREADPGCAIGRRPEGLRPCSMREVDERGLGRWLADAARLEAASVIAFERLAEELEALGAPKTLVELARESAADEVRHARATTKLAKRYGGVVAAPLVEDVPRRSLFEVARENAVEGCVRETFGALVATFQVEHAESADIRAAMLIISRDETKHSALAWEIAAWAEPLLDEAEREIVARSRIEAAKELRAELCAEPHEEVRRLAGMPKAADAVTMFDAAARELWAA